MTRNPNLGKHGVSEYPMTIQYSYPKMIVSMTTTTTGSSGTTWHNTKRSDHEECLLVNLILCIKNDWKIKDGTWYAVVWYCTIWSVRGRRPCVTFQVPRRKPPDSRTTFESYDTYPTLSCHGVVGRIFLLVRMAWTRHHIQTQRLIDVIETTPTLTSSWTTVPTLAHLDQPLIPSLNVFILAVSSVVLYRTLYFWFFRLNFPRWRRIPTCFTSSSPVLVLRGMVRLKLVWLLALNWDSRRILVHGLSWCTCQMFCETWCCCVFLPVTHTIPSTLKSPHSTALSFSPTRPQEGTLCRPSFDLET
jgi:hypothetical protein